MTYAQMTLLNEVGWFILFIACLFFVIAAGVWCIYDIYTDHVRYHKYYRAKHRKFGDE